MDTIVQWDRWLILLLARPLRTAAERTGWPVHAIAFWSAAVAQILGWAALSVGESRPAWLWYLSTAGIGAVAAYVAGGEPVALVEDRVALTAFGAEARYAIWRLAYLGLAVGYFLPLIVESGFPLLTSVLFLVQIGLFVLMEYLLAFRIVAADDQRFRAREELRNVIEILRSGQASPPAHD